jgi:D-glycero-alpha-D-manno-heptose 1-phosphate guanylyltransferase
MDKIDAIILAGGLGTRLKGLTLGLPKVLVPINGKPFLDIVLSLLNKSGWIRRVIIAVGFMSDKIINRYADCKEYNFEIHFSEEKELLGTGGAIKKALQYTKMNHILALNGDSYIDVNFDSLIRAHRTKRAGMTIVLTEVDDAKRYGSVTLANDNKIISFEEKINYLKGRTINAGMYLFNKNIFDPVEPNKVLSFEKDLLPDFIKDNTYGYITHGKFIDIGTPETYRIAGEYLKELTS